MKVVSILETERLSSDVIRVKAVVRSRFSRNTIFEGYIISMCANVTTKGLSRSIGTTIVVDNNMAICRVSGLVTQVHIAMTLSKGGDIDMSDQPDPKRWAIFSVVAVLLAALLGTLSSCFGW